MKGFSESVRSHQLNRSQSKQQYSFGRSARFTYEQASNDFFYALPSTLSSSSACLGYGPRFKVPVEREKRPGPTAYSLPTSFSPTKTGFTFGRSREECKGLSMKELFVSDPIVPGPGAYGADKNAIIKSSPKWTVSGGQKRTVNIANSKEKVPGPGTYNSNLNINSDGKFCLSNWKNVSGGKFSDSKLLRFNHKIPECSERLIESRGFTALSSFRNRNANSFSRSLREIKAKKDECPGPGAYDIHSEFGHLPKTPKLKLDIKK